MRNERGLRERYRDGKKLPCFSASWPSTARREYRQRITYGACLTSSSIALICPASRVSLPFAQSRVRDAHLIHGGRHCVGMLHSSRWFSTQKEYAALLRRPKKCEVEAAAMTRGAIAPEKGGAAPPRAFVPSPARCKPASRDGFPEAPCNTPNAPLEWMPHRG